MKIFEVYEIFEKIGCCSFSTVTSDGFPVSRIAHFVAYDQDGLYFSTMNTKPFYQQLKESGGKISVCGMKGSTHVDKIDQENISFEPGYFARLTGVAEEISTAELRAKDNPIFTFFLADQQRYPAMVAFVIRSFQGEIYDYDFEKVNRPYKLERYRFKQGDFSITSPGFTISDACVNCGKCVENCSFSALQPGENKPKQLRNRCDECGDCVVVCPVNAIKHKGG